MIIPEEPKGRNRSGYGNPLAAHSTIVPAHRPTARIKASLKTVIRFMPSPPEPFRIRDNVQAWREDRSHNCGKDPKRRVFVSTTVEGESPEALQLTMPCSTRGA